MSRNTAVHMSHRCIFKRVLLRLHPAQFAATDRLQVASGLVCVYILFYVDGRQAAKVRGKNNKRYRLRLESDS